MLPKCLSLSSQTFRDTGSRRFRIAKTTIKSTATPIVKSVPVSRAANGKIDKPSPPSVDKEIIKTKKKKRKKKMFIGLYIK